MAEDSGNQGQTMFLEPWAQRDGMKAVVRKVMPNCETLVFREQM